MCEYKVLEQVQFVLIYPCRLVWYSLLMPAMKTYPSIDPVVAPPILLNVIFVFTSVAMTLRSQRSIYGHCLGHGSGTCMFKAAREICTISYEVNKCRKHMLLNDILQLVVLLDNYTTIGPV